MLTDIFYLFEVIVIRPKVREVVSPFIESVGDQNMHYCQNRSTYSFAIRRLTATSFSTPRSSNVCGVKASLRRILLHIGHGAGPRVNNRSMQDSHLFSSV